MDVSSPLPKDDPRIIAWEKYKASEEYQNTFNWAAQEKHREGSLWAAFIAGYTAAKEEK